MSMQQSQDMNQEISKQEFFDSLTKVICYLRQKPTRMQSRYEITQNNTKWYNSDGYSSYILNVPIEKCWICESIFMYDPDEEQNILQDLCLILCEECEAKKNSAIYYTHLPNSEKEDQEEDQDKE